MKRAGVPSERDKGPRGRISLRNSNVVVWCVIIVIVLSLMGSTAYFWIVIKPHLRQRVVFLKEVVKRGGSFSLGQVPIGADDVIIRELFPDSVEARILKGREWRVCFDVLNLPFVFIAFPKGASPSEEWITQGLRVLPPGCFLRFWESTLSPQDIQTLGASCRKPRGLTFWSCHFRGDAFGKLVNILHDQIELSISNCRFDTFKLSNQKSMLVKTISFSSCLENPDDWQNVFRTIHAANVILSVSEGCPALDEVVVDEIVGSTDIRSLTLRVKDAGTDVTRLFGDGPPCRTLEQMNLWLNEQTITPTFLATLARRFPNLQYLTLGMCTISPEAVMMLSQFRKLEGISFVASALLGNPSEALLKIPHLKKVEIVHTRVETGSHQLARVLRGKGIEVFENAQESESRR